MLDQSALGQLKDLKKQIVDATPRIEATVKGTKKRFGFVIDLADKQEYLLPQTEMEKVLPGDVVKCILQKGHKEGDKPVAMIEHFVSSSFDQVIGTVKEKNQQMYILPDHPQLTRWIFIPPKHRKNISDGDMVSAKIIQHPYNNKGRVQAEISYLIGKPDDPFIEHRFAIAKHNIPEKIWQPEEIEAIRMTAEKVIEESKAQRSDLSDTLFFTIDGANTQDLDDALSITDTATGWRLSVAIADVSQFVEPNSPLDKLALKQISSIYLPGQKVPMLPDVLSSNLCSLKENEQRLVLICNVAINHDGSISATDYQEATIKSRGKLCYEDVANFLTDNGHKYSDDINQALSSLNTMAQARRAWRKTQAILGDDYPDYRLHLNERGKITSIDRSERNIAQHLVEECMLACNQATAEYFHSHSSHALYLGNKGFKAEQMPGVKKLLSEQAPDVDADSLNQIEGYIGFLQSIQEQPQDLAIAEILKKKLHKSEWLTEKTSHFGLGFNCYTTFTSPIRKYCDLVTHRMIKQLLAGKKLKQLKPEFIEQLNLLNNAVRGAQRDCEMNLKCQYLQAFKGKDFSGEISMINHRVIGVYLSEFDIHGQIEVRSLNEEYSFKQESLQLSTPTLNLKIKQRVNVCIDAIDQNQRSVKLRLIRDESEKDGEGRSVDASQTKEATAE